MSLSKILCHMLTHGTDRAPVPTDCGVPEATGDWRGAEEKYPDSFSSEPSEKQMRISAVHHVIAAVVPACKWVASIAGVDEVIGKDGTKD